MTVEKQTYVKWPCGHFINTYWPDKEKCWLCLRDSGTPKEQLDALVESYQKARPC